MTFTSHNLSPADARGRGLVGVDLQTAADGIPRRTSHYILRIMINKAYKPPLTLIEFDVTITGTIS